MNGSSVDEGVIEDERPDLIGAAALAERLPSESVEVSGKDGLRYSHYFENLGYCITNLLGLATPTDLLPNESVTGFMRLPIESKNGLRA